MTPRNTGAWLDPQEFLSEFHQLDDSVVMSRKGKKLREGYLIANLCLLRGAKQFRLLSIEEFDGQYIDGDRRAFVEVTELLDAGRKRGLEFEGAESSVIVSRVNMEDVGRRIVNAVATKSHKKKQFEASIGDPIELLMYFNLSVFRSVEMDVSRALNALPVHCFDKVHVLIGTHTLISHSDNEGLSVSKRPISRSEL